MNISESLKSNSQPVTSEISEKNLPAEKIENLSVVDKSESLCQQAFKLFASQSTRNFFVPIRGELPDGIFWDDATEQERQWATEDAAKKSAEMKAAFDKTQSKVMALEPSRRELGRYTLEEAVTMLDLHEVLNVKVSLTRLCVRISSQKMPFFDAGSVDSRDDHISFRPYENEVYWDDLNIWLEQSGIRTKFRFPNPEEANALVSSIDSPAIKLREEHKALAWKLGKEYLDRWQATGKYEPTIANVGSYIEAVFSGHDKKIYNEKGGLYTAASIIRKYLTGITGRSKGYRSKKPKIPSNKAQRLPTDDDFK